MEHVKTILLVHNYYQIPGGEDTVVANEKVMLEEQGYRVILYCRNNSELKSFSIVRKMLLPFTTIFNFKTYGQVRQLIRKEGVDIVQVHNTLNLISPAVYYAALSLKTPVIQTIHNFRLLCPGATFYRSGHICEDCVTKGLVCAIKHNCYRQSKIQTAICVVNTLIHRITGVYGKLYYICLTEFNKRKLLEIKQICPERVFVKPNFVLNVSGQNPVPFDNRNGFAYVGRLDSLKGIEILFQAWKKMGDKAPVLNVCGTGPMKLWCEKYISDNKLTSICMKGYVSNKQARAIVAHAKAMILPTQWYEGFPMSMVEAFSVGTPVIGSNVGNVGDLISIGTNGWIFQKDSPEDLLRVVKNVSDIVQSTYRCFQNKYTDIKNYELMEKIYEGIKK